MKIAIVGAGGHAREVLDIVRARGDEAIGFLVESGFGEPGVVIHGLPILGHLEWIGRREDARIICGVGAPDVRHRLVRRAEEYGAMFGTAVHPNAVMTEWTSVGAGVVIAAGAIITNEIVLGDHVHINVACTVSHDCRLEDFVTLSPGTHLAGGVTVGEGSFFGVGAVVLPRVTIGAWSTVGAGAVVTDDVPPNTTVVGVPAREVNSRQPGWHLGS